jgi:hypothetical protein
MIAALDPEAIPDMRTIVGSHDLLFITLDALRYDVAQGCHRRGETPALSSHLPAGGWERRHTPGSFTYAAHQAFFAGFLPTPARPGPHPRLFALAFEGSETTVERTVVFNGAATIVEGFAAAGYHSICIGGVGFFNLRNPLGCALSAPFAERHWRPEFGVVAADSTAAQVALALERLAAPELAGRRLFLFLNVSALHPPHRHYAPGAGADSVETQAAALRYVDGALTPLLAALERRGPTFAIVCSDHGSALGEDGYIGHRLAHEVVMHVPYAHFVL